MALLTLFSKLWVESQILNCAHDQNTKLCIEEKKTLHFLCFSLFPFLLQCYMFHMYVGVRAGGGIGDQIEDPAGDEYEIYRIIFDITFFFFVIVILLAIIQGEACSKHMLF